ncbi:MAG: hypothetical protein EZS28_052779, partial [Streblomastix strix]
WMKTLTFRRPSPNPLWCVPSALSPMYLNAQLLSGGSIGSYAILLDRATPGESNNLPFTYLGSWTWFYYTSVGEFQVQKLDQKAGWPVELGAGGTNKLDYYVYCSPNVGATVGPVETGLVTENLKIVVYPGTFQIPGMVIFVVLVSVVLNKTATRSRLVQTSPAMESVILVPSQLRSIGLLAGQLGPDFLVLVSISTHAMVKLRVT